GDRAGRADLLAAAAFVAVLVLVTGLVVVLGRGVAAEDVVAVLLGEAGVAVGGDDHGVVGVHGVGEQGLAGVVELDRAAAGFDLDLVEFGAFRVVDPAGARRAVGDVDALVEFDGGAEQLGGAGGDVEAPGVVVVDGDDRGRVRDGHGRDGAGAGVSGLGRADEFDLGLVHAAVAAQRRHLLRGGVEDGDAVAEDGERELLARLGDDLGGDGLGAALARLDLDDGAFAGDADPEFAVAVEGAAGEAGGEGQGLADLLEGAGVHLADQALCLVDDERAVVVEGDADAFAGDGLGRAGEGEGGEVDGADLAGGDVPQQQVG